MSPSLRFAKATSKANDESGQDDGRAGDCSHGLAERAILFFLGGAPVMPVSVLEIICPGQFNDDNAGTVLVDKDRVVDLPLEVDESRAIEVVGQGGKLC